MTTRYTLTVPVRNNAGDSIDPAHWDRLETFLAATFGGYSEHDARGAWIGDDGTLYHDVSHVYTVDTDITDASVILDGLAAWVADVWSQDCVYLTASPNLVQHFVSASTRKEI